MGLVQEEDQKRFFNQIALEGLKGYLHPKTQFIQEEGVIPLFENCLAAHALLSSKLKENMEQAKDILDKLLYFQNGEGLFPQNLHQFPQGALESYQLDIAFVLHQILMRFALALGEKLQNRLKKSIDSLFFALKKSSPFAFEKMQARFEVFNQVYQQTATAFFYPEKKITSTYLGEKLRLAQETTSYEKILEQLAPYWHPLWHAYTGPLLDESYIQGEPQLSLFDYFMSSAYRSYYEKLHHKNLLQLQGTFIRYAEAPLLFKEATVEDFYKDFPYTLINNSGACWFFFKNYSCFAEESKGFHLFRCLFKSLNCLYHFVCHSKVKHMNAEFSDNTLSVDFTYFEEFPQEVKQQNELEFFINLGEDLQVCVEGKKASLFHLGSTLELRTKEAVLRCIFTTDSPDAQIVGHLLYGNRPSSQDVCFVDSKAYDQKIVLRTLRRSKYCKVRMDLQLIHK